MRKSSWIMRGRNRSSRLQSPFMITDVTRERAAELRELVEAPPAGRWLVLTHDNPDPDALASACC